MENYEAPKLTIQELDNKDWMIASNNPVPKNPGHYMCTVMPNGKPIPENAVGRYGKP